MKQLKLAATARTPLVILDPSAGTLVMDGESYPEDVNGFYQPIMDAVAAFCAQPKARLTVDIKLIYFNSSSARALSDLCDLLDAQAGDGASIQLTWFCDDDDITREFAEDLALDMVHLRIAIAKLQKDG
jgi:hypothetical protein